MLKERENIVDSVSVRNSKPPKGYQPPKQEQGEPYQTYMQRLDAYNAVYWDQRNWG